MRELKFVLDSKSLQTIYFSFIRPLLEYADVVWDNCTKYEADQLEKIEIEAALIVTGATRLVPVNLLYCETEWDILACRETNIKSLCFIKCTRVYLLLTYLHSCQPTLVQMPLTTYVTLKIFKQYNATLSFIIILFFQVPYELGMASQRIQEISTVQRQDLHKFF